MNGCDGLVDLCHLFALQCGLLSEGAVAEDHADAVLLEQQFAVALDIVVDMVGDSYRYFSLSIGTCCAYYLLRVSGKTRKEQNRKEK